MTLETVTNNVHTNSNAILPSMQEFQMFQVIAKNAQDSGLYAGVGQQAKIFMILLAARELGIPPMLALNGGIWNIQGKIEISARLMSSLIRRAGHKLEIKSTDKFCTIRGIRKDTGEDHEETFTWAMAEKAGLTQGNVWKKYPEDMLYNRCISRIGRRLFADVCLQNRHTRTHGSKNGSGFRRSQQTSGRKARSLRRKHRRCLPDAGRHLGFDRARVCTKERRRRTRHHPRQKVPTSYLHSQGSQKLRQKAPNSNSQHAHLRPKTPRRSHRTYAEKWSHGTRQANCRKNGYGKLD